MVTLAAQRENDPIGRIERIVQVISEPHFGSLHFIASPAQFGMDLNNTQVEGELVQAQPYQSCSTLENTHETSGRIVVVQRGNCMFQDKARFAQNAGAIGVIVADHQIGSSVDHSPVFAMSADNNIPDDIEIPVMFLFHKESQKLLNQKMKFPTMKVRLAEKVANPGFLFENYLKYGEYARRTPEAIANAMISIDASQEVIRFNFRFAYVNAQSSAEEKQMIVETNMQDLTKFVAFSTAQDMAKFLNHARRLAYSLLGYTTTNSQDDMENLKVLIPKIHLLYPQKHQILTLDLDPEHELLHKTTSMICNFRSGKKYSCYPL
uniref:PA domain-containing protein n=2 Tax=Acrobeloides nanus TaxID=290746 RepID=A0A914CHU7_9BILA